MNKRTSTSREYGWFGPLLIAVLSFGLFTYSGFVADSYSQHRQTLKSEQVVTKRGQPEDAISIGRALSVFSNIEVSSSDSGCWVFRISRYHNHLSSVQLKALAKQLLEFESLPSFLTVKTISVRSDHRSSHLSPG